MSEEKQTVCGAISKVTSAQRDAERHHIVQVSFQEGIRGTITFLEEKIFRYDVSREGSVSEYAAPRDEAHTAKIQQRPDSSDAYMKPEAEVTEDPVSVCIRCKETCIVFEKETGRMTIYVGKRKILEEAKPLEFTGDETIQTLARHEKEQFYGGGTQNGRFVHTGKKIQIVNESAWMDGGVASPNPFYYTTAGYGVLRNTFSDGTYDFGETDEGLVLASHKEHHFSAYYFLTEKENGRESARALLRAYYHVTGNPMLLPEYGFYEGHLNCYNRDAWSDESGDKARSEERRVGKECRIGCRSRWSPYH